MFASILAAALVQGLGGRSSDLWQSPLDNKAYAVQLQSAALSIAGQFHHGACPAGATVHSLGYVRLGTVATVIGIAPGDPVDATAGVYKERVRVDGCADQPRKHNVLTMRTRTGNWFMLPMLPGDSLTTPVQQHDVVSSILQLIQVPQLKPECHPGDIPYRLSDTFVIEQGRWKQGEWSERWVQTECGVDRSVKVHFMPRPDGRATSVQVEQDWPAAPDVESHPDS